MATRSNRKAAVSANGHGKNGAANGSSGVSSGFVALSLLTSPARARRPNPADGPPCHMCTARCCKYFALGIDKPTSLQDYDHIRWYLMHEGVAVWVDDGDWYVEVRTVCKHLQADNTCGIYENRPEVCREYGTDDDEGPCEYFTDHLKYDRYWDSDIEFEAWYKAEYEKKRKKRAQRRALQRKAAAAGAPA